MRRETKKVKIGSLVIGGDAPIVVQSMCDTDTRDIDATVEQILRLEQVGCELIRVAVPDQEAADAIGAIKKRIHIPLVADIHFDYRLALSALKNGVDKLRINPGNIGSEERIRMVVEEAKSRQVPIRIGVNGGSLEKKIVAKYGRPCAEAMVESALEHIHLLEKLNFEEILISVKASNVLETIEAYRLLSKSVAYPLHLGITEAGPPGTGTVRSAVGMGVLLAEGIGDTLRVSLSGDPAEEIHVAWQILKSLELRERGVVLISCPTCGRRKGDVYRISAEVEKRLRDYQGPPITVAIMGCEVNGPAEAKHADVGLAFGIHHAWLFVKGEIAAKISPEQYMDALFEQIDRIKLEKAR
jgi:(E)-4-hydroxy-3-methylbut-2-enyl-diphosphate synthase